MALLAAAGRHLFLLSLQPYIARCAIGNCCQQSRVQVSACCTRSVAPLRVPSSTSFWCNLNLRQPSAAETDQFRQSISRTVPPDMCGRLVCGDEATAEASDDSQACSEVETTSGWQQLACGSAHAPVVAVAWAQACDGVLAADGGACHVSVSVGPGRTPPSVNTVSHCFPPTPGFLLGAGQLASPLPHSSCGCIELGRVRACGRCCSLT